MTCAEAGYDEIPDVIGCFYNATAYIDELQSMLTVESPTFVGSCVVYFSTLFFGNGDPGPASPNRQNVCQGEEQTTSSTSVTTVTTTARYNPTAIVYPDVCQMWFFYVATSATISSRRAECSAVAETMVSIQPQVTVNADNYMGSGKDTGLAGCVFDLGGETINFYDSQESTEATKQTL